MYTTLSRHAEHRMAQRGISLVDIDTAVESPLLTYTSRCDSGDPPVVVCGEHVTVVIGAGGAIITAYWSRSTR
jgi:hypothetical protein